MSALLSHRLVVVTGKGGVGRTTATAALGLTAARAGRRTAVVELSGQSSLSRALGLRDGVYEPRRVVPGLDVMSLSATACLADFGTRKLRISALARWFFESRAMTGFVEAVPGLHDLVQLGKLENMLNEPGPGDPVYDLVILDAPATGHGLSLLAAARSMREMTGVGPFHDLAAIIEALLEDPVATGTALVTLPEALPVNEGLQLVRALADEHTPPSHVLVNQVSPAWPDHVPPERIMDVLADRGVAPDPQRSALRDVVCEEVGRHAHQTAVLADLAARLPREAGRHVPVTRMPRLEDPSRLDPLVDALWAGLALGSAA